MPKTKRGIIFVIATVLAGFLLATVMSQITWGTRNECSETTTATAYCQDGLRGFPVAEYKVVRTDASEWTKVYSYEWPIVDSGRIINTAVYSVAIGLIGGIVYLVKRRF